VTQRFSDLELNAAQQLLRSDADPGSESYRDALAALRLAVQEGRIEFAETVAETHTRRGPNHDAALAYTFYYMAYALDSYSVALNNQAEDSTYYSGPIGDFRNEAPVSDLIQELGLAALPELDAKAASLLATVV
jgi:hypothetical protein